MNELDYAFLADYAAVQDGKLTVVGASFTDLIVDSLPGETMLSVAGRVRCPVEEDTLSLEIMIRPPNDAYEITAGLEIGELHTHPHYGEKRGVLFAIQMTIPLPTTGLYDIAINVGDTSKEIDRILKFSVKQHQA